VIVETQHLSKRFSRHDAVHDVSLSVPEGAALALIGANGAGKTTTLRMLVNLVQPSGGEARVFGVDSRDLGAGEFARIGYVSENQKLPDGLTVAQYFDYLRQLYPSWDAGLETDLRARFDLPAARKLGKLSHGTRLKTVLAAALPFKPALLILDEPLSGLDPLVRDEVMESLLSQAGEMTIVISSHELAEIEGCATDVAFLDKGRLLFQEPMEALSARFRDVGVLLEDTSKLPAMLPTTWLAPQRAGQTLQFIDTGFTDDAALARQVGEALGPVKSIDTRGMSLRDISKTLMRAQRQEAGQ
jgi:ABC-2 type transport system ATP-binding protein